MQTFCSPQLPGLPSGPACFGGTCHQCGVEKVKSHSVLDPGQVFDFKLYSSHIRIGELVSLAVTHADMQAHIITLPLTFFADEVIASDQK